MSSIQKLQYRYSMLDSSGKLITWLVVGTLLTWLLKYLYSPVYDLFVLPGQLTSALLQPWSYVTYAFVHSGIFHVLFNMLALNVVGMSILNLVGRKPFLSLFYLGVFAGGVGFTIAMVVAPSYFNAAAIVGASAGVYALLFFLSFFMPDTQVRLFVWNVKLIYIAYALLAIDLFQILGRLNAGGSVAHLMGAGLGYLAAVKMQNGQDITSGFHRVIDFFDNLFSGAMFQKRKTPLKKVYKNKTSQRVASSPHKSSKQAQIDAVLDKISTSGYESLTTQEKEILFKAGED